MDEIDSFLDSEIFSNGHTETQYAKLSKSFAFSFPLNFDNEIEELNLVGLLGIVRTGTQDPSIHTED